VDKRHGFAPDIQYLRGGIRKQDTNPGKTQDEFVIQTTISGLPATWPGEPDPILPVVLTIEGGTYFLDEYIL
jgi:hypothetical protein